ncbi:hypothetical protein [Flavobacterium sp. ENC]|uniref:hypothetical protein n=1 Tax=Flavobacterium sp. ENC TaxID=2897330 RepID=UPI001E423170|nr:hypothetical protein [Flavobacterium sp. ENC]MCD0465608.1 hypothetical protein [Flavobacterium sp. ENC]
MTKIYAIVCHFDEGEIPVRNSTKIGDSLYGSTGGDFSFVEMTKIRLLSKVARFGKSFD